ncbi:MAG: hypothetical protein H6797_00800 [Candidatus Nomurabacteria bacterium]|nr:MAG: hypothetical protein H6797_00800 [Candidatus Nomurabacteria bacterium]
MARLPQPGGDNGNWGHILNDYLSQTLKADGTLKDGIVPEASLDVTVQSKLNGITGKVDKSILTTKGDIYVAAGSGTPVRLGVGMDGQVLTADSSTVLGVSWAAVTTSSQKRYCIDDFGADPTGVVNSDDALVAARGALGNDPGVIEFGAGEYKFSKGLNTVWGMDLRPKQGVRGQGKALTKIYFQGQGAVFEFRNPDWTFNSAGNPYGGVQGMWIDGWSNTNTDTYGIRYGDSNGMTVADVHVAGFNQAGCAGLYGDNQISWSERADIEISVEQCTTCFLFESNATSTPAGSSSFDYSRYRLTFVAVANQDVFVLRTSPGCVRTSMNGVQMELTGNCNNAPSDGTNSGVLWHVGYDNDDEASFSGTLQINVETSGYSDGVCHKDFVMGGVGPWWLVKSRVRATGAINLIPFSGVNFAEGGATPYNFSFDGLLYKSPSLGSSGYFGASRSLQLQADSRGRISLENTNAAQLIYVTSATAGTYRLNYGGTYTDTIPYNASTAQVQAALEGIPALAGNVTVVHAQSRFINGVYANEVGFGVDFIGSLSETAVPTLTADMSSLTGGVDIVVANTGSPNKTINLEIESGNMFVVNWLDPGTYRIRAQTGNLTDSMGLDKDSPFGATVLDVWIQQPTTGGNVILEGPYFPPGTNFGSSYNFQWLDGIDPVLSTTPNAYDVIRLSTFNFNAWIGQHVTRKAIASVPSTSSSPGIEGQIAYDADYMYVCTDTDTWKRSPIGSW